MRIQTDTHIHTIASTHAYSTILEYVHHAAHSGIELISITDHGPSMPDSPHHWHFLNMKVIPRVINNIAILRGVEANIQADGSLDMEKNQLSKMDLVIGSLHSPVTPPGNKHQNTQTLINAIKSNSCQIIGHPGNPLYPIDADEVVRAAKDHNVLLEINNSSFHFSRPGSKTICKTILETVLHHDWKISFGSDAHFALNMGCFDHCIQLALETGFSEKNIVSSSPTKLLAFLREHGKSAELELQDWLSGTPGGQECGSD